MNEKFTDIAIEKSARLGYHHSMKILDFLHPNSQPKYTWETDTEACREEWREKARIMLEICAPDSIAFVDGHGESVKHSDLYDECPACKNKEDDLKILRDDNARMRRVLEMLSKRQIATWYSAVSAVPTDGYYAGWDDAEYAVRKALQGEDFFSTSDKPKEG